MKTAKAPTIAAISAGFFQANLHAQPAAPASPGDPSRGGWKARPFRSVLRDGRRQGGGEGAAAPERISFHPWAEVETKVLLDRKLADEPTARCPGIIRLTTTLFLPGQFVQSPGQPVILYEWDHHFRVIPTDGRKQVEDPDPPVSLAQSVGRWEGDTLAVDVVGLSDYTWIDGNAGIHSDALHIVE